MEEIVTTQISCKIKGINTSDGMFNILVTLPDKSEVNIKTDKDATNFIVGSIYLFDIAKNLKSEKNSYYLVKYKKATEIKELEEINKIYRAFDSSCPLSLEDLERKIYGYIEEIKNPIIKHLTNEIVQRNYTAFFTYPAAQRLHHAYVGGLAYHTLGMLELVDGFLKNYKFISKDYMYAGTILHDMGKVQEFTGIENTEYALKGQLLGHLVMGGIEVSEVAKELGYSNKEEVLFLEHMIISHHGQQIYGACKKPQTAEALLLWYIDTLDSKFRVLGEHLEKTKENSFTDPIGVLEKTKFYKHQS